MRFKIFIFIETVFFTIGASPAQGPILNSVATSFKFGRSGDDV